MIWFSSDWHIGHQAILQMCRRPFSDLDNQKRLLIQNFNEVVGWDDTTFILGDFAMGRIEDSLKVVKRLNGKKILVPGNHDRCFIGGGRKKAGLWRTVYLNAGFTAILDKADIHADGHLLTLSHFPFRYEGGSPTTDKFWKWRPTDDGQFLLCGHSHRAFRKRGKTLNVGVDVQNYYPISMDEAFRQLEGEDG